MATATWQDFIYFVETVGMGIAFLVVWARIEKWLHERERRRHIPK